MPRSLDLPIQHPLKKEIRERGIPLWMIRDFLGGRPSEFKISRMLNGIEVMPIEIRNGITNYISFIDQMILTSEE